jgi:GNAT superfamily N-acetyltransferase
VWSEHFASPAGTRTLVAEHDGRLVGFVHVVFDASPTWGSLVDNLHVVTDWHRAGVGTRLLAHAATAVTDEATRQPLYLWVLEQNTAAQCFYQALGAVCVETAPVPAPGGDPARLAGSPSNLRMTWPDAAKLTRLSRA